MRIRSALCLLCMLALGVSLVIPESAHADPKAGDARTIGGMEFVYIPSGSFMMGSPDDMGYYEERPRHRVTLDGFWMGKYEVTQAQYEQVMGNNPSRFKEHGWFSNSKNHPVESVSWHDVQEFCRKFAQKHKVAVRLPTEAEWEYAARAGSETAYYWGNTERDACRYANVADRAGKSKYSYWLIIDCNDGYVETAPVGRFRPNGWGLYDMSGNVCEWCADWFDEGYYARSPEKNPKGPDGEQYRVRRGGSWGDFGYDIRSACRLRGHLNSWFSNDLGFRVVVPAVGK